jgi:glutamyl-tRNA reductase
MLTCHGHSPRPKVQLMSSRWASPCNWRGGDTGPVELVAFGLDHATAGLELRERLAVAEAATPAALARLTDPAVSPLQQAVILSTCNRVEVYAAARTRPSRDELVELLGRLRGLPPGDLTAAARVYRGDEVPHRLAATAAGLHSLVLGEAQIQGQVRRALELALAAGTAGPELRRLFETAIAAGRRVRSTTDIGRGVASVPHAAVQFAQRRLGALTRFTVLLLGAGTVSDLAAKHLVKLKPAGLLVIGRDPARAESLAARHGGRALGSDALVEALVQAHVVICSTGAPRPVLHRHQLERALPHRQDSGPAPLLLIDLALPRDVDPAAAGLPGIEICTIDDLQRVVERTREQRRSELPAAQSVLSAAVARFTRWLAAREAAALLTL